MCSPVFPVAVRNSFPVSNTKSSQPDSEYALFATQAAVLANVRQTALHEQNQAPYGRTKSTAEVRP